jgi:hypothetical protein
MGLIYFLRYIYICLYIDFFFFAKQSPLGHGLLIHEVSRSHSLDASWVGPLWMGNQPDAETSIWQHKTITTDRHPYSGGIRTHNFSRQAAADPLVRPRGHWDRHIFDRFDLIFHHMVRHPHCVFINYNWINQLSSTTIIYSGYNLRFNVAIFTIYVHNLSQCIYNYKLMYTYTYNIQYHRSKLYKLRSAQ